MRESNHVIHYIYTDADQYGSRTVSIGLILVDQQDLPAFAVVT